MVLLSEWSRIVNEFTGERTRLVKGPRQQLWRHYPQFLKVRSDLTKSWVPELWKHAPTPGKARRLRPATIETSLKHRRGCVVSAQDVLEQFTEIVAPGTADTAVAHIRVIVNRLPLVARELSNAHRQIDRLTAAVETAQKFRGRPGEGTSA